MADPKKIFLEVVGSKAIDAKWSGKPHQIFKSLPNSNKGDVGEEFIRRYAEELGFTVVKTQRLGDWDLTIQGKKFEIKLATEDVSGAFQFNHIRYDSKYHYLLCLGITPDDLRFGIWTKADVATGNAGNLVSMGKNQNSSFKLTKKTSSLQDIEELKKVLEDLLK